MKKRKKEIIEFDGSILEEILSFSIRAENFRVERQKARRERQKK